jgi:hypothetical protein
MLRDEKQFSWLRVLQLLFGVFLVISLFGNRADHVLVWAALLGLTFLYQALLKSHVPPQIHVVPTSTPSAENESLGRFEVSGVDRESKMDTTTYVTADSAANARVKAELDGIIVTQVRRAD